MLRATFQYFSTARWARKLITGFAPTRKATRRFVAGETVAEAMAVADKLNGLDMLVSLDHLGENVQDARSAELAAGDYCGLIGAIESAGVQANCSLKLTQLGLDLGEEVCLQNLRQILDRARAAQIEITIDMESSAYTQRTLDIFHRLHADEGYQNLGTVIQAYLYRSQADMAELGSTGATVRLCKGAYQEPARVAFPRKADVDSNYVRLMQAFLSPENRAKGAVLQIATHDLKIIANAETFIKSNAIGRDSYEFQMLYGIRGATQQELAKRGHRVRVYVPYGTEWYPYFMRRLAERPANVWFIARSLVSQ